MNPLLDEALSQNRMTGWVIATLPSGARYLGKIKQGDTFAQTTICLQSAYMYSVNVGVGEKGISVKRMVLPIDGLPAYTEILIRAESFIICDKLDEKERELLVKLVANAEEMRRDARAAAAGIVTADARALNGLPMNTRRG